MAEITIEDLRQRHIEAFLEARRAIKEGIANLNTEAYAVALLGFATELAKQKLDSEKYRASLAEFASGLVALDERRGDITQAEQDGVNVRAAARCGWFDDLDEDDVGDLEPWRVDQLSTEIIGRFNDAMTVPEN